MGPKLLAAFGAGALLASAVFFLASRSQTIQITPQTIPSVVPPVEEPQLAPSVPPEIIEHPAPTPKPSPVKVAPKTIPPFVAQSVSPADATAVVTAAPEPIAAEVSKLDAPKVETTPAEPIPTSEPQLPPPPPPRTVIIPAGALIQVRLGERLATDRNLEGDVFAATLDQELVADGWVIAEAGTRVLGRIVQLDRAGRVKGIASMTIELTSITTSDGQKIPIHTAGFVRKGTSSKGNDAGKIAFGSAIGAVIGAAAGGGAGAAIGAASGGAAGAGVVLATRGKATALEAETRLSFRLDDPVTITERR